MEAGRLARLVRPMQLLHVHRHECMGEGFGPMKLDSTFMQPPQLPPSRGFLVPSR